MKAKLDIEEKELVVEVEGAPYGERFKISDLIADYVKSMSNVSKLPDHGERTTDDIHEVSAELRVAFLLATHECWRYMYFNYMPEERHWESLIENVRHGNHHLWLTGGEILAFGKDDDQPLGCLENLSFCTDMEGYHAEADQVYEEDGEMKRRRVGIKSVFAKIREDRLFDFDPETKKHRNPRLIGKRHLRLLDIENTTDDYIQFWKFYIPPGRKKIDLSTMPENEFKELCKAFDERPKGADDGLTIHSIEATKYNWSDYLKPVKRTIKDNESGEETTIGTVPETIDGAPPRKPVYMDDVINNE